MNIKTFLGTPKRILFSILGLALAYFFFASSWKLLLLLIIGVVIVAGAIAYMKKNPS